MTSYAGTVDPPRVFSFSEFAAIQKRDKPYYALSYLWRKLVDGERGWITRDLHRDMGWKVTSTKYDMVHHLCEAIRTTGLENFDIWMDALCICQTDEDEKRTEVSRSRHYYANAELCILCPWMAYGVSPSDHREAGKHWIDRSWPVQEVMVAKKVALLYNINKEGYIDWRVDILTKQKSRISGDAESVYGKPFADKLQAILEKSTYGKSMYIENAMRLACGRHASTQADLIYAYAGLSGIYQKLGIRKESIINTVEWLYHALPKRDRIRILAITAKPMQVADGVSWMPNYSDGTLVYDCNCVIDEVKGEIDKYETGIGVTLINIAIIEVLVGTSGTNERHQVSRYCTNGDNVSPNINLSLGEGDKIEGYVWGYISDGRYKAVIIGKTRKGNKDYHVAALCCQPHSSYSSTLGKKITRLQKVGICYMIINIKVSYNDYCIIG